MSAKAGSLRVIQWCQGEDLRRALVPWQQRILLGSYQLAKIDRGVRDFEFKKFQRWIHQIYHVPFFSIFSHPFPSLFFFFHPFSIHFPWQVWARRSGLSPPAAPPPTEAFCRLLPGCCWRCCFCYGYENGKQYGTVYPCIPPKWQL